MNKWKQMIVGAAAVALISATAVSGTVWAQSAPNAGPDAVEAQQGPGRSSRGGGERGDRVRVIDRAVVKDAIASALGMTTEELAAAKDAGQTIEEVAEAQGVAFADVLAAAKASMTEQVNTALAAGEITQEQADAMLERIAAKDSLDHKGRGGRGHGERGDRVRVIDRAVVKDVIASALGMTTEELAAAKDAGQTIEETAEAQGVAFADVLAAAKASMTEQVNTALAAGEITQEQADAMLERIAAKESLDGRDGRGHHGGERGESDAEPTSGDDESGNDESDDGETPLARGGSALATSSASFVATDFLYLPTVVGQ